MEIWECSEAGGTKAGREESPQRIPVAHHPTPLQAGIKILVSFYSV